MHRSQLAGFMIDCQTTDLDAAAVRRWVVMEAPTGQRFCVVRAARANFTEQANTWD